MKIFQMTGLSGAGKTTIAQNVCKELKSRGYPIEILDGDFFRNNICKDLGFSKADRLENIRRMGFVASLLSKNGVMVIIAAINPYEEGRKELAEKYQAKTIFVDCDIQTLRKRDTKGLYKKAFLPDTHPEKIHDLSGVNDTFEIPENPDLVLDTSNDKLEESLEKIMEFILKNQNP